MYIKFKNRDYIDSNQLFSIGLYTEHRTNTMHSHEFWEISYVYEGSGTHYTEDLQSSSITKGQFIVINPGPSHCIVSPQKEFGNRVKTCNLLIKKELMHKVLAQLSSLDNINDLAFFHLLESSSPLIYKMTDFNNSIWLTISSILAEYKVPSVHFDYIIESNLRCLILQFCNVYEHSINANPNMQNQNNFVDEIESYIESNYENDLSLELLSQIAHVSKEHLSRSFKKKTGITISSYINNVRIDNAKHMLTYSTLSIGEIALACGFTGNNNFEKVFKKKTGCTAREYKCQGYAYICSE